MREYVTAIAHFFRNAKLAMALLTDMEYDALAAEATQKYYHEIHAFPVERNLSLYERMVIANDR